MRAVHSHPYAHHFMVVAERACARAIIAASGVGLMVLGVGLGVTMIMLPVGIGIGLTGAGLTAWGVLGDLPIEE